MDKAYISNLAAAWPLDRQQTLLAKHVPGWPVETYRDELKPRWLKACDPVRLEWRSQLTRSSGRQSGNTIHVASLAVLAWRVPDFRAFVGALSTVHAVLVAHNEGQTYDLRKAKDRQRAMEQFPISRTHSGREKGLLSGAQVSAARRNAASKAACEPIKERWGLSADLYRTADLIAETGLSRNTVEKRLGKRRAAQARVARNLKRQQAKMAATAQEAATP